MAIRCETHARAYDKKPMSEQHSSHTRSTRNGKGLAKFALAIHSGGVSLRACVEKLTGRSDSKERAMSADGAARHTRMPWHSVGCLSDGWNKGDRLAVGLNVKGEACLMLM